MRTYYTVRSQGGGQKTNFPSEEAAFAAAEELCLKNGLEAVVVLHEGDSSRLVRKVSQRVR